MKITITGTTNVGPSPYLAKLLLGNKREFARRVLVTNTTCDLHFDDLNAGDVLEWRACIWAGSGYTSGSCTWAIVLKTDCILVGHSVALQAVALAAAGNPVIDVANSDFAGDLHAAMTADEERRLRQEVGGDFIALRTLDGNLFVPKPSDRREKLYGTIRGQAWMLPAVTFCDCEAAMRYAATL